MRQPSLLGLLSVLTTIAASNGPAIALDLDVPVTHPTLQAAVAAAALSADVENTITISVSPVMTNATVDIGGAFGPTRHLVIRPAAALGRASVVNLESGTLSVGPRDAASRVLEVALARNPARTLDLVCHATEAGRLEWIVLDAAGRVQHRDERWVAAASRASFTCPIDATAAPGLAFYRVRLVTASGRAEEVAGKVVLLK